MVGAIGFEPTTPSPPAKCATRLRYAPTESYIGLMLQSCNKVGHHNSHYPQAL